MNESTLLEKMREIVSLTETAVMPALIQADPQIQGLNYDYGSTLSVINRLVSMDAVTEYQFKKYPLIAIVDRLTIDKGKEIAYAGTWKARIIIANQTSADGSDKDRFDRNINPILMVVYNELLQQIAKSKYFSAIPVSRLQHRLEVLPFWGKEGLYGNLSHIANDYLDCIQITNLELKVRRNLYLC